MKIVSQLQVLRYLIVWRLQADSDWLPVLPQDVAITYWPAGGVTPCCCGGCPGPLVWLLRVRVVSLEVPWAAKPVQQLLEWQRLEKSIHPLAAPTRIFRLGRDTPPIHATTPTPAGIQSTVPRPCKLFALGIGGWHSMFAISVIIFL